MTDVALVAAGNKAGHKRSFWKKHFSSLQAWSVLGPVMVYMFVFAIFPVLFVVYLSFTQWNGAIGSPRWVGLDNYVAYFTSPLYLQTIRQTLLIGGISLVLSMTVPFALALLLNLPLKARAAYRAVWYIPVVTSYAIISQIVIVVLNPVDGSMNRFLEAVGIGRVDWQLSTGWMVFWISAFALWKNLGAGTLFFLAGLQSVDPAMYEAAKVDGAGAVRRLIFITIPLMRTVIAFVMVLSINGMFQLFEPVLFLTKGEPNGTTSVIVYRIYRDAFSDFDFGMASVGSVFVMVAVLLGSMLTLRMSKQIH